MRQMIPDYDNQFDPREEDMREGEWEDDGREEYENWEEEEAEDDEDL